jgi:hypothetical protein
MPQPEIVPAIASRAHSGWALHGICTRMGGPCVCLTAMPGPSQVGELRAISPRRAGKTQTRLRGVHACNCRPIRAA